MVTAGNSAASNSRDAEDLDMEQELLVSLKSDSPDEEPWRVIEKIFLVGQDRDTVVQEVLCRLVIQDDVWGLRTLFSVLKDGRGCGPMKLRGPNDVPAETVYLSVFEYLSPHKFCQAFVDYGLDLKKRYRLAHARDDGKQFSWEFDLWMWVSATSTSGVAKMLSKAEIRPDLTLKVYNPHVQSFIADGWLRSGFRWTHPLPSCCNTNGDGGTPWRRVLNDRMVGESKRHACRSN